MALHWLADKLIQFFLREAFATRFYFLAHVAVNGINARVCWFGNFCEKRRLATPLRVAPAVGRSSNYGQCVRTIRSDISVLTECMVSRVKKKCLLSFGHSVLMRCVRENKVNAKTFPVRLTEWRKAKGLAQKQAADKFDVSFSCYQKWEQGRRTPEKLTMCEIDRRMAL